MNTVRVWDLPTRLFHWALAAFVVALVVTAKVGGNAMSWHGRLGYAVLALLLFRFAWGLVGGRWSRFASFLPTPARLLRYLRGQAAPEDTAGHTPLGALSVFALLTVLSAQVGTGLFADDEIAFTGPLTALVSGSFVSSATTWHKGWGQYLVIGLIALHLVAIAVYQVQRKSLVRPMLLGDKALPHALPGSRDTAATRLLALLLLALAAGVVWWVVQLGNTPTLG